MGLEWLWDATGAVVTRDFWSRIFTRPLEAVFAHPGLAATSALVAGGAVALGGLVLKAAPFVGGAVRGLVAGGRVAAAPLGFAARHPIASYLLVTQADLPTEIVRAVAGFAQRSAGTVPAPAPTPQVVPVVPSVQPSPALVPTPRIPVQQLRRGPVSGQAQWQAIFGW